jgi:hypothetical protein
MNFEIISSVCNHSFYFARRDENTLTWGSQTLNNGRALNNDIKPAIISLPAKTGIQYYQVFPRFRVKPKMMNKGVVQRFQPYDTKSCSVK